MTEKKVVFILGIGRSGSTLLDLMLGSHPDAFSLGEISKLPEIVAHGKTIAALDDSHFWDDTFTLGELNQLVAGLRNQRLHQHIPLSVERFVRERLGRDQILNPYTVLFEKIQKPVLVDSSKYLSWIRGRLKAREFRDRHLKTYLIHMVRDGRAVVNSYSRIYPNRTIAQISHDWLKTVREQTQFFEDFRLGPKMRVRYEHLSSDPEGCLKNVCALLGIDFVPSMIEYWRHDHHHIVGSRGTTALIQKYRNQATTRPLEDIHGDYYDRIGFQIKLDVRWRDELSEVDHATFNAIGGAFNRLFEWPPERDEMA